MTDHTSGPTLELSAVTKRWGQGDRAVTALDRLDMQVERGSLTAIMGASGSGKSTLLHCAAGLCAIDQGKVLINGSDLGPMNDDQRTEFRRRHLGLVFQAFNLVPTLDAQDNVALPLLLDGAMESEARQKAEAVLQELGLADRRQHRPDQLSGGEQQRVAIARALVSDPDLILADEPTGNLDSRATAQVGAALQQHLGGASRGAVIVTHEVEVAAWAERVIVIADGRVADDFPTPESISALAERVAHSLAPAAATTGASEASA
jgi:putative ABC transport system ATP-binding protein